MARDPPLIQARVERETVAVRATTLVRTICAHRAHDRRGIACTTGREPAAVRMIWVGTLGAPGTPMNNTIVIALLSTSLLATACKKSEDSGSSAKSERDPGKTGAPAKAPEPTCSATAWKEPSGLFCVEAKGFTADPVEKAGDDDDPRMQVYFKKPPDADPKMPQVMFHISWYPKQDAGSALSLASNMEIDYKNNTGIAKGEFAAGKGRFFIFARKSDDKSHKLYALLQGKKHAYLCEGMRYGSPIDPDVIAACKSLLATD
jgi:hypothetical protein